MSSPLSFAHGGGEGLPTLRREEISDFPGDHFDPTVAGEKNTGKPPWAIGIFYHQWFVFGALKIWFLQKKMDSDYNNFKLSYVPFKSGRIFRRIPRSDSEPLGWLVFPTTFISWLVKPQPTHPTWKICAQSSNGLVSSFPIFEVFKFQKKFENCHQNPCIETMGFKRPKGEHLPDSETIDMVLPEQMRCHK